MTERIMTVVAAMVLAATLAACGASDKKDNGAAQPDNTPNGSITTQPDTNGTDGSDRDVIPGDSMNGGNNATGGAVPGDGDESVGGGQASRSGQATRRYDRALTASLSRLLINSMAGDEA